MTRADGVRPGRLWRDIWISQPTGDEPHAIQIDRWSLCSVVENYGGTPRYRPPNDLSKSEHRRSWNALL